MIDKGGFYKAVLQVVREMQSERSGGVSLSTGQTYTGFCNTCRQDVTLCIEP